MSLNPPMTIDGEPCRVPGEHFMLKRNSIEFEVKVPDYETYKGKGFVRLILTTCRLVLINTKKKGVCKAFDLPLAYIYSEKFNQPIFGSNYESGMCKPLYECFPTDCKFKIWFTEGGCMAFLSCFKRALKDIRKNTSGAPQHLIDYVQSQQFFTDFAYFDPNDPSTVYVTQPPVYNPEPAPVAYSPAPAPVPVPVPAPAKN